MTANELEAKLQKVASSRWPIVPGGHNLQARGHFMRHCLVEVTVTIFFLLLANQVSRLRSLADRIYEY